LWGTAEYFAPEMYSDQSKHNQPHQDKGYGYQVDIWALGCLLYEMLTGELAFPFRELYHKPSLFTRLVFYGGHKPQRWFERLSGYKALSMEAKDLLQKMLHPNPKKRLQIDECLHHIWLSSAACALASSTCNASFEQRMRHMSNPAKTMRTRQIERLKRKEMLQRDQTFEAVRKKMKQEHEAQQDAEEGEEMMKQKVWAVAYGGNGGKKYREESYSTCSLSSSDSPSSSPHQANSKQHRKYFAHHHLFNAEEETEEY